MNSVIPITIESSASRPDVVANSRWYAIYTLSRHEKSVSSQLNLRHIETYLPLFEKKSQWKDRVARLQLPLFPGYVFVRVPANQRVTVLNTPGVVRFVSFSGYPAALSDTEIESLRRSLLFRKAEPHPYLVSGKRVRIDSGPLAGIQGTIVRRKGNARLVISIDSIQRSIALELEATDVRLTA